MHVNWDKDCGPVTRPCQAIYVIMLCVFWTDETKLDLLLLTVKHGGGGLMIRACLAATGLRHFAERGGIFLLT